jgi:hypothetical protein
MNAQEGARAACPRVQWDANNVLAGGPPALL